MKLLFTVLTLTLSLSLFSQTGFDRKTFYHTMAGDNKVAINAELATVQKSPVKDKDALEGALTMKKAGVGGSPTKKLSLFKQGHKLLEAAIKREPSNAEYRFLRLMIQENAPGFLGYKSNLKTDSEFIQKSYKSLPADVQEAIADYSKKSKVLKLRIS